jgi:hypothetical protein
MGDDQASDDVISEAGPPLLRPAIHPKVFGDVREYLERRRVNTSRDLHSEEVEKKQLGWFITGR